MRASGSIVIQPSRPIWMVSPDFAIPFVLCFIAYEILQYMIYVMVTSRAQFYALLSRTCKPAAGPRRAIVSWLGCRGQLGMRALATELA